MCLVDNSQCDWWVPAIYDQTGVWLVSDAVIGYSPELQLARHCQGSGNPDENVLVVRSVISSLIRVTYTVAFLLCRWAFPPFLALGSGFACQPYIDSPQSLWPGFDSRLGHLTALPFLHFYVLFSASCCAISVYVARGGVVLSYGTANIYLIASRMVIVITAASMFALWSCYIVVELAVCDGWLYMYT